MPAPSPGNPSSFGRRAAAALLTLAVLAGPRPLRAAEPTTEAPVEPAETAEPAPEAPAEGAQPAQPAEESGNDAMAAKAMEAFRRGEAAYEEAKYEEALASFQEASSFYASPAFQYNIGRCYENLERYEDAVRSYEIYLRAEPEAADSGDVRERIGRLRGLLEAKKAGEEEQDNESPPPPVTQTPVEPVDDARPPGRVLVISGSVLLGVGAALAIGGGVGFGIVAGSRSDDLDEIQTGGNPNERTFADAQQIEEEGKQAEVGQIVTAAVGGAVAVGGIALLAIGLLKNKNARSGKTTRVIPTLNRRAAGLVLTGRF